jgi:hypothetical protein
MLNEPAAQELTRLGIRKVNHGALVQGAELVMQ